MFEVMSYHAQVERAGRLAALEEVLGFTSVAFSVMEGHQRLSVTSSGILIVQDAHTQMVVTAYAIKVEKLYALCRKAGKKQIPPKLQKRVQKNFERHPELFQMSY